MPGFSSTAPRHLARHARRVRAGVLAVVLALTALAAPGLPAAAEAAPVHAVAWGDNSSGQLGTGALGSGQLTPVDVSNEALGFKKVSASHTSHSLAIDGNGSVWAWGANNRNQLGRVGMSSPSPLLVNVPVDVVDVAAGFLSSVALRADGKVWTWGDNEFAQLGRGSAGGSQATPQQIAGLSNVVDVEAGGAFVLALRQDGTVWGWGRSHLGQTGPPLVPAAGLRQIPGLSGIVDIAAGNGHGLAVRADGAVFAWGYGFWGQLGDGMSGNRSTPVQVPVPGGAGSVAAGEGHSLALRADGTVFSWGRNDLGQLGDNTFNNPIRTPAQMQQASGVVEIEAGEFTSFLRLADGTVRACGYNIYGLLGDGTTIKRSVPVQVQGLTQARQISAGGSHVLAVRRLPPPPEPPAPAHTIEVEPNYVTVPVDGSATVTVGVGGSTAGRPVSLFMNKNFLPGVTATFDPPTVMPGQSSQLTLTTGPDVTPTAPRVTTVLVRGLVGSTIKSASLDLTIGEMSE